METARFMAGLYHIPSNMSKVSFLDAGAGSGILSCAFIEQLEKIESIREIDVICYENDSNVLPLLQDNLRYCKEHSTKKISFNIVADNYILSQYLDFNNMIVGNVNPKKYDFVIGNPPYMKIPKDAPEAKAMPDICYGAPNLYFIFAAMGLFNLTDGGEMVYIIPRSWTSGAYFKRFRQYFLREGKLEHIHLFVSRNKVFDKEDVLQEIIIVKIKKTHIVPGNIKITSSKTNKDFDDLTSLTVPYDIVVSGEDCYVYLVTDEYEVDVLRRLHGFDKTLPEIGVKMKTVTLEADTKIKMMKKLEKLIEKRTDGIMNANRRNYYGECAAYIAAFGEVKESQGEAGAKQKFMTEYKNKYNRRSAFRAEMKDYGWKDCR